MGQLTPSFLVDLETNMRIITANEYERLAAVQTWQRFAKPMSSISRKERLTWLFDSAQIEYRSEDGGEVEFDDILSQTTEYTNKSATAGLDLNRNQLDDHDGGGVQLATHWSRQMGAYAAYWPQKQCLKAVRDGEQATSITYDGEVFFSADHPVNPFNAGAGTFSNLLSSFPIDQSVSVDVAFDNLSNAIAAISDIKMPNGEDPRLLRTKTIMGPPKLMPRVRQMLDAKVIAQAASSGGGSANVEAIIRAWGFDEPIEAPELAASFPNGSDTDYYIISEQITGDDLGALNFIDREPFTIIFNDAMTDSELARANRLQWLTRGRNVVGYGHPYLMYKVS